MKKSKLLVYILAFLFGCIGVSRAAELQDGFMGIQWGTDIADLPDFVKVAEKGRDGE